MLLGLPVWAIQLIVTVLQKTGAINWAEALLAKGIDRAVSHIETLKTYQEYPSGKGGA